MFRFLKNLFKKEKLPKPTGFIYRADKHRGWGNAINFESIEVKPGEFQLKAHGHLSRRPRNGDIIESRMGSGKIAQLLVFNVDYVGDPPDMWFSDLALHQYIDDFSEPSELSVFAKVSKS